MTPEEKAKQRIEIASEKGWETLNLSGLKLSELPEEIGKLTRLRALVLSGTGLESLSESLGRLTQLRSLDLSGISVTSLPQWLNQLTQLQKLDVSWTNLTALPETLGQLTQLQELDLSWTNLTSLPESLGQLRQLQMLDLSMTKLTSLPDSISQLKSLKILNLSRVTLSLLPDWLGQLTCLNRLLLRGCGLVELPSSLAKLEQLEQLDIEGNPLNLVLMAAYEQGLEAFQRYLQNRAAGEVVLNEAKLILVGEGGVGKSCLLGALRGDPWVEGRSTTHGIEIKTFFVTDATTGLKLRLNGWDFGGQRIYRPTHQLFFSSPAIYLVVWRPREGFQQGLVKEWIKLVTLRVPDAKILVVATHGGPGGRQPDIDRQEIWELFGRDTIIDFFHVESRPTDQGEDGSGIQQLRETIARVAAELPGVGRKVPVSWQQAWQVLKKSSDAYLPISKVVEICREQKLTEQDAELFIDLSHCLGHLIHYEHDPTLRDLVVLKPDWLASAISLSLDDKEAREAHGLVRFVHLCDVWSDVNREESLRYPQELHPVFLRLMERFDLSYRVSGLPDENTSLIAQLVPVERPNLKSCWADKPTEGEEQQVQICQIVEGNNGSSAPAEGLFYQLIVRLHKYSLGRENYKESKHWQRGLVLDADYNGRALLEQVGHDVRITVRAAYPERFLSVLTSEVKWLVESFWKGLRCEVMVPCISPCGKNAPGTGLYEVQKLISARKRGETRYPCPTRVCDEWQSIDSLLRNAPAASRKPLEEQIGALRIAIAEGFYQQVKRFDRMDRDHQVFLSQMDEVYYGLLQSLIDEAKDGPRLFSFEPVEPGFWDRPSWVSAKFRLTLWCEHSRLPLPSLNEVGDRNGVYELNLPRKWLVAAAPFLKVVSGALGLVLPVAASGTKLVLDSATVKDVERQLDFGQKSLDSVLKGGEKAGGWMAYEEGLDLEDGVGLVEGDGPVLRQLHVWLKEKDPGFGGLVRVQNRRREFLWVHRQFAEEY